MCGCLSILSSIKQARHVKHLMRIDPIIITNRESARDCALSIPYLLMISVKRREETMRTEPRKVQLIKANTWKNSFEGHLRYVCQINIWCVLVVSFRIEHLLMDSITEFKCVNFATINVKYEFANSRFLLLFSFRLTFLTVFAPFDHFFGSICWFIHFISDEWMNDWDFGYFGHQFERFTFDFHYIFECLVFIRKFSVVLDHFISISMHHWLDFQWKILISLVQKSFS